ncbi:hypothetical protein MBVR141_00251 [Mycoplasmopsis bovirhinis]|uniref:hypothetical protein n=1 Tax=Mycoplasmopsis bovirhinis TaxID=29553 RepID=UPI000BB9D82C|nr:hypothetical protein [Mycoplasmopsis bovirhinis]BBA22199.1 hypothetical protein MBVR141_00251 [Mycoplasmopsis bovirhinis]
MKKSLKKFFTLLSTSLIALPVMGLSANTNQTNDSAYFERTITENGKKYHVVNVSFELKDNEIKDLKSMYSFISFTLEHPNVSGGDNVMYLGYTNKVEEITISFKASGAKLQNGKFNEATKTYSVDVKFAAEYAWTASNFKFEIGLGGRQITLKPKSRSVVGQSRSSVRQTSLEKLSHEELLKLAASVETYKPEIKKPFGSKVKDFAFIPLDEKKVNNRNTSHMVNINPATGKPYLNIYATNEYTEIYPYDNQLWLVPIYQVVIPNNHKFSKNGNMKMYLNMTIQQDGQSTGNVSYVVDSSKAELIKNLGSNKADLSIVPNTYKVDDELGYITFQLRLGTRWDPSKTRIVMSFNGYRNGSYFEVAGKNRKVGEVQLTKWQQNEIWKRGTWNKYVSLNNPLNSNLEGKELTIELSHPDTPKTAMKYTIKGGMLVPVNGWTNKVKFSAYVKNGLKLLNGNKLGFYVEFSSLFDPTKAIIKVTYEGKTQEVKMPNFWDWF